MTVGMVARCILSVPFVVLADNFTPDRTVIYKEVSGVELKLHVFEPEGSKASELRPAIIFFFGGGWAGDNPKQFYQQARTVSDLGMESFGLAGQERSEQCPEFRACLSEEPLGDIMTV